MRISKLVVPVYCLLATGCASIVHGTRQEVAVSTEPPDAIVSDGEFTAHSPCKLNLQRDQDHVLTITKDGYEPGSAHITHVISGAVAGNILAGGIIGWGVDAATGAQYRLEPETLCLTLRPIKDGRDVGTVTKAASGSLEEKLAELDRLKGKGLISEDEYKSLRGVAIRATP